MPYKKAFHFIFSIIILVLVIALGCKTKIPPQKIITANNNTDSAANYPLWIAMMNDPNVNYYKAVEAFDKFWEHREKPTEADGEGKDIYAKDKDNVEKGREAKRTVEFVYEYKQFLNWQQRNKNLVKPDGTIMTQQEIINQSENEMKTR